MATDYVFSAYLKNDSYYSKNRGTFTISEKYNIPDGIQYERICVCNGRFSQERSDKIITLGEIKSFLPIVVEHSIKFTVPKEKNESFLEWYEDGHEIEYIKDGDKKSRILKIDKMDKLSETRTNVVYLAYGDYISKLVYYGNEQNVFFRDE